MISQTKICKECKQELNKELHFYKGGSNSYQTKCKCCYNKYSVIATRERRNMKPKIIRCVFYTLSDDTQDAIKKEVAKGTKLTLVAKMYNIKYSTLYSWKSKGRLNEKSDQE